MSFHLQSMPRCCYLVLDSDTLRISSGRAICYVAFYRTRDYSRAIGSMLNQYQGISYNCFFSISRAVILVLIFCTAHFDKLVNNFSGKSTHTFCYVFLPLIRFFLCFLCIVNVSVRLTRRVC